jgi:hypothetical protein
LESKSSRQKKWAVILRETRTKLKEMWSRRRGRWERRRWIG